MPPLWQGVSWDQQLLGLTAAQGDHDLSGGPTVGLGPYYKLICKRLTNITQLKESTPCISTHHLQWRHMHSDNAAVVYPYTTIC